MKEAQETREVMAGINNSLKTFGSILQVDDDDDHMIESHNGTTAQLPVDSDR